MVAKRERALSDMADQARLQAASIMGDQHTVDLIQHRLDLERLIEQARALGLTQAEAEKRAAQDLLAIDTARAAERQKLAQQAELEYQIELAQAKGDTLRLQQLQDMAEVQRRTDARVANGDNRDVAALLSQSEVDQLRKAVHTAANDFDAVSGPLKSMQSAFESHDWGSLSNSLVSAIAGLKGAFGPNGTLAGKIGAVAGVGNMIGGAVGGKAGGVLSGAASGAMMGAQLGSIVPGIGTAIGAVLGGLGGAISGMMGNDHARDDAAKAAEQKALSDSAQAATAALEKLNQQLADYGDAVQAFYRASGQSQKALKMQRDEELKGLDDATAAIKRQTFAWDDYNDALKTANDNITSAQDALKSAFQTESQALQGEIDAVEGAKQALVDAYQAEAASMQAVIGKFQQFHTTLLDFRRSLDVAPGGGPGSQYARPEAGFQSALSGARQLKDDSFAGLPPGGAGLPRRLQGQRPQRARLPARPGPGQGGHRRGR
jgi:hypothetical protein